jgi:hypothetical protein
VTSAELKASSSPAVGETVQLEYWLATDAGPRKVILTGQTLVAFAQGRHRPEVEGQLSHLPELEMIHSAKRTQFDPCAYVRDATERRRKTSDSRIGEVLSHRQRPSHWVHADSAVRTRLRRPLTHAV